MHINFHILQTTTFSLFLRILFILLYLEFNGSIVFLYSFCAGWYSRMFFIASPHLCYIRSRIVDNVNYLVFALRRNRVASLIEEKSERFSKFSMLQVGLLNHAYKSNASWLTALSNILMPFQKALWITCKEQLINGSSPWNPCSFADVGTISLNDE